MEGLGFSCSRVSAALGSLPLTRAGCLVNHCCGTTVEEMN